MISVMFVYGFIQNVMIRCLSLFTRYAKHIFCIYLHWLQISVLMARAFNVLLWFNVGGLCGLIFKISLNFTSIAPDQSYYFDYASQ